jgi:hypothetical protein
LRIATNIVLDLFLVHCDTQYVICPERVSTRIALFRHVLTP